MATPRNTKNGPPGAASAQNVQGRSRGRKGFFAPTFTGLWQVLLHASECGAADAILQIRP